MKRLLYVILLLGASCSPSGDRFDTGLFKNPDATWRSMSFWSLNDSLRADEMTRQIKLFKEGGFGGVFLHSRPGLLTPYLSEDWFDMMKVGIDETRKLGMEAWFYDEDKWPSGFAGGIVPRQSDDYRAKTLVRLPSGSAVTAPDELLLDDGEHAYVSHVDPMGQPWYNGTCWVDLMNPETVKAFIDCTYQPYMDRFKGIANVKGIFSDEPQVSARRDLAGGDAFIPYSPVMEKAFRERWGYEMDANLASLADTVGNWRQFRLHYWRTVGECLENAFSKQLGEYCESNGLKWTGHFNREEEPYAGMLNEGNLMIQYRNMQVPGIDALGLRFKTLHNCKVMTSVANQYDKRRRVCEIFGISGHNLSFEDRMWLTAWHTNCGINMLCPHLSHYTLKGTRKYDYPPSFNYQEPYWPDNKLYEDYAARLCYFAGVGRTKGEICVLSTLESDYLDVDMLDDSRIPQRDALLEDILQLLNGMQFNSDLGDEQVISETGSVSGGLFRIGAMEYHTMILPDILTLRPSTLALLEEFAAQGGNVVVCGDFPKYLDGVADTMQGLRENCSFVPFSGLAEWLAGNCVRDFNLEGQGGRSIWTHLRNVEGGNTLQMSNISRTESQRINLLLSNPCKYTLLLDPIDGSCLEIHPEADGSYLLEFAPAQTYVLYFGSRSIIRKPDGTYSLPRKGERLLELSGPWNCWRMDPNAMPLDFAQWSTDGGATWHAAEPVLAIYDRFNSRDMVYNGPMKLRYHFVVDDIPGVCSLVVEQPWMYKDIRLNGAGLHFGEDYYVDTYFRTADIASLLKQGDNEVVLTLDFVNPVPDSSDPIARYGSEIESVWLCGDFSVRAVLSADQPVESWRNRNPLLNPKPLPSRFVQGSLSLGKDKGADAGNLTLSGYPFYAGRFECECTFEMDSVDSGARYLLSLPGIESITVKPRVNGKDLPALYCSPWETDITDAVQAGINELELILTGSLRNLMGPYHCVGGEFYMLGPATFSGKDSWPNIEPGDNDWYEKRKTGSTRLWRDDYYCIPFGILERPVLKEIR